MRKTNLCIAGIAVLFLLSSCTLLPQEEALPAAPLVEAYTDEPYSLVYVERGSLELSFKVSASYVPVKTETLRFDTGGELIDEIFVEVGDTVQTGDLLVQLESDGVSAQLSAEKSLLELRQLHLTQLEETRKLELTRLQAAEQDFDTQNKDVDYEKKKRDLNDQIHISQMKLAELSQEYARRQLRAGIDGTVVFVKKLEAGELSTARGALVTISDLSLSAFSADTELWPHLHPGEEYTITVNDEEYDVVTVDDEALGLPFQQKAEGEKAVVYLTLKQPDLIFDDGAKGILTVVMDRRDNVLILPVNAITTANGEKIVYYQNEAGVRSFKKIRTGLQVGTMVEITGGLAEGECVILPLT